jgi:hypothetical protein
VDEQSGIKQVGADGQNGRLGNGVAHGARG